MIATLLGDFGADVIKVEHPHGDGLRQWEWRKDGESLWWALVGRNKRDISLSLSDPRGADVMRRLLADADVFIENFRPGTLEKWGLDPEDLIAANPKLVVVRVSGFGQTGPYRSRPGFGTIAEAMSGFADTNGAADGPPVLPQWPLADGVAALAGAFATMIALRHAEATGHGQVVDLSIYEPLFWILGAQTSAYDQLGTLPTRQGSRTGFNVPRECYRTRDGRWIALSGATTATAQRIMRAVGRRIWLTPNGSRTSPAESNTARRSTRRSRPGSGNATTPMYWPCSSRSGRRRAPCTPRRTSSPIRTSPNGAASSPSTTPPLVRCECRA